MNKPTLFISDLHLEAGHPEITAAFERFLKNEAKDAEALYILGDFFEAWVGDDDDSPFIQHIKSLLKGLSDAGIKLYFIRGNRDFLIGKRFCRETGMTLLKDPTVIELHGERILLTHGDYLCTDDKLHQRFRHAADNRFYRFLFLLLPLSIRKKLANYVRNKSKTRHLKNDITDVNQQTVEQWLQQHGVLKIIHGHTHRPATHEFTLNGRPAKRIVLSDWDENYYFHL